MILQQEFFPQIGNTEESVKHNSIKGNVYQYAMSEILNFLPTVFTIRFMELQILVV